MLSDAATNQIIGAATAGLVGVFAALLLKWIDDRRRRKSVARAILQEMLQTVNALLAALPIIEGGADIKKSIKTKHQVSRKQMERMRPFDRKVFSALGEHLGALSDIALSNTVAFDGTIQLLDRKFDDVWYGEADHVVAFNSCNTIAISIRHALHLSEANILAVIWDAHGPLWKTPKATLGVLEQIRAIAKDDGANKAGSA